VSVVVIMRVLGNLRHNCRYTRQVNKIVIFCENIVI